MFRAARSPKTCHLCNPWMISRAKRHTRLFPNDLKPRPRGIVFAFRRSYDPQPQQAHDGRTAHGTDGRRFKSVDKRFEAVDERFDRLTARMDAGFSSIHDKLNAILNVLDEKYRHHEKVLTAHDRRLKDLERSRTS